MFKELAEIKETNLESNERNGKPEIFLKDSELWREFKEGSPEAYAIIYRQHFFAMFSYGKKFCPDTELLKDAIQDVFIKIWNNRKNLSDTTSIKHYLFTALKRKVFDVLKSANISQTDFLNDYSDIRQNIFNQDDDGVSKQSEKVLIALNRLSAHQQKLLDMKFYKNLSSEEMAEELGIGIQSVYNAIFKALKNMRKHLSLFSLLAFFFS